MEEIKPDNKITILVRSQQNDISITLPNNSTIKDMTIEISKLHPLQPTPNKQRLFYQGKELPTNTPLADIQLKEGTPVITLKIYDLPREPHIDENIRPPQRESNFIKKMILYKTKEYIESEAKIEHDYQKCCKDLIKEYKNTCDTNDAQYSITNMHPPLLIEQLPIMHNSFRERIKCRLFEKGNIQIDDLVDLNTVNFPGYSLLLNWGMLAQLVLLNAIFKFIFNGKKMSCMVIFEILYYLYNL